MYLAEKFNRPIISFVDTPGAYPGIDAEERGQAEAIAYNLREMVNLKVPTIVVIVGEGGSGGALAIGVGDRVLMLENAVYSVITPEGCAAILWKDAGQAARAAECLKLTAGPPFTVKVPQVDADGNEVAGVRNPVQSVPLGTYMGWNIDRSAPAAHREMAGLTGSYIPFPATRAERERTGDSRLSIEERYPGRAAYLDRVTEAARKLASERYLLEADVPRIRARAAAEWDTLMPGSQ